MIILLNGVLWIIWNIVNVFFKVLFVIVWVCLIEIGFCFCGIILLICIYGFVIVILLYFFVVNNKKLWIYLFVFVIIIISSELIFNK